MQFYSTQDSKHKSDLKSAVLKGLAPGNGLYMPESIPTMDEAFWDKLAGMTVGEIGFETLKHFFCPDIPEVEFKQLTADAFNFPIPLVKVTDKISSLELFHGPTLAFKDVGARFLARVMASFTSKGEKPINVLVATSGDTGSAVANGFLGVDGVNVVVLYPKGLVSNVQEKQFTTLGQNITAVEVEGTFDDCQRLVKTAFMDEALCEEMILTSANSINLARFLPQMVYYFYAVAQMSKEEREKTVICVPSGNFGNLTAGLIGHQMGLPIKRFIAATNINDIVPQYMKTGKYKPAPSVATPANAMDVGDPSNFVRIQELFKHDWEAMRESLKTEVVTDEIIHKTIKDVYETTKYVLDPHGAVAYKALEKQLTGDEKGIFIATAHPAKFPDIVEAEIGREVEQPERLKAFLKGEKQVENISGQYEDFKKFLQSNAKFK